jgi:glutamate carboxypeptidase
MPDLIHEIKERVGSRHGEILEFLKSIVQVNSFSRNYEGVNRVGDMIMERIPGSLDHTVHTDRNTVRHHILSTGTERLGSNLILVGHTDTVFPPEEGSRPFEISGNKLHGAGGCLINGDEEIGSPHSQQLTRKLARWADYGLVFEGAGAGGDVVFARRGIRRFQLTVKGQAQHAGVWEGPKASAILEIAQMVQKLEALNDDSSRITLNVGKISGGTASNVIPEKASAIFEYRFWDKETENETLKRIISIVENPENSDCRAEVKCHHTRPAGCPVPGSKKLYEMVSGAALELNQAIEREERGGTSDLNFIMDEGVPGLDGMGPIGGLDHSEDEYILKESLFERIELTALVMARLI